MLYSGCYIDRHRLLRSLRGARFWVFISHDIKKSGLDHRRHRTGRRVLAELLLSKDYIVHGVKRRSSLINTDRIDHLYHDPHEPGVCFFLHYGDLTDATNLIRIVQEVQPTEIYNLAAQSHVQVSFETPEYTANSDALGTLRLLEAIRILGLPKKPVSIRLRHQNFTERCRLRRKTRRRHFIRARLTPPRSSTPIGSRSITAKPTGSMPRTELFNHEGPTRAETFVTRKITRAVAAIHLGFQDKLFLGNLDAKRDWGHARDYVDGMWRILQQPEPGDYVLATGETHSVREFAERAFAGIGIEIGWRGAGVDEQGFDKKSGRTLSRSIHATVALPRSISFSVIPEKHSRNLAGSTR